LPAFYTFCCDHGDTIKTKFKVNKKTAPADGPMSGEAGVLDSVLVADAEMVALIKAQMLREPDRLGEDGDDGCMEIEAAPAHIGEAHPEAPDQNEARHVQAEDRGQAAFAEQHTPANIKLAEQKRAAQIRECNDQQHARTHYADKYHDTPHWHGQCGDVNNSAGNTATGTCNGRQHPRCLLPSGNIQAGRRVCHATLGPT
jgi:hypothetical protein